VIHQTKLVIHQRKLVIHQRKLVIHQTRDPSNETGDSLFLLFQITISPRVNLCGFSGGIKETQPYCHGLILLFLYPNNPCPPTNVPWRDTFTWSGGKYQRQILSVRVVLVLTVAAVARDSTPHVFSY
jgi:hypothetical protein